MTQKTGNKKLLAVSFIILQTVIYGFGDPISKAAYASIPVYSLLTARYAIASLFLLLFFGKRILNVLKNVSVKCWLVPVLCTGLAYIIGNVALGLTEATTVGFIRSLPTIIAPLLAFVFYRKKYRLFHLPFQLMVLVGLYLLCGVGGLHGFGAGELCAVLCAVLLAGSLVFGEKSLDYIDSITLTALQAIVSCLLSMLGALVFDHGFDFSGLNLTYSMVILYLAVPCTIIGLFLQNAALESIPAFLVALVQSLGPIMTAFFSWLVLREQLTPIGMIGAVLILLCVTADTVLENRLSRSSSGAK